MCGFDTQFLPWVCLKGFLEVFNVRVLKCFDVVFCSKGLKDLFQWFLCEYFIQ